MKKIFRVQQRKHALHLFFWRENKVRSAKSPVKKLIQSEFNSSKSLDVWEKRQYWPPVLHFTTANSPAHPLPQTPEFIFIES